MTTYAQPGAKRQKVRERVDNVDFFQGIDRVEFNSSAGPTETTAYRYYNASERLHSRSMEDWLKISVSLTHFRQYGSDSQTRHLPPQNRPWDDGTTSLDNHKRCVKALFDLMSKLNVRYYTAFDTDFVPHCDSWDEWKSQWDEMVEFVQECQQRCHVKLLWMAPDLHSHPRYTAGAFTNPDAKTYVQAAAQIKKCIEMSHRLSAECVLLWPCREGYCGAVRGDVSTDLKLFAKLFKMAAEFKERINYRGQLLIQPYYGTPAAQAGHIPYHHDGLTPWTDSRINTYMWDITSCLYFLKTYNLERYYKVCCWPGHHMFMANVYNMLGGVTITKDVDCFDSKSLTMMMRCIVEQGSAPPAGISLQLRPGSGELRDVIELFVRHIDAMARGLRVACTVAADQIFTKCTQQRYSSYQSGFGSRLLSGDTSLEECEEYHKKNQTSDVVCTRNEHYDLVFQRYLDACDHV